MEVIQFTAAVMLLLLTLELMVMLPRRVIKDKVLNRSRWLMASGMMVLAGQFFLQYKFGFRTMGVTQAVMINLMFFVPCSTLFTIAVQNLQDQGKANKKMWIVATISILLTWTLVLLAAITDDHALREESKLLRWAEYAAGVIYSGMQTYFTYHLLKNNKRLQRNLNNYYDDSTSRLLRWMQRVIIMTAVLALGVPFLIFSSGILLKVYSAAIFFTIFYMITSFTFYCVSNDAHEVMKAEQTADEAAEEEAATANSMSDEERQLIAKTVDRWVANDGYLHVGLTIPKVAEEMQLPRYQLVMWLKTTEWELFNPWLTHLRIERAKHVLLEHREWSNDAVAHHCGFTSRNYFQQVFKKSTGMTPAQFVEQNKHSS